jgi:hypothetical protein
MKEKPDIPKIVFAGLPILLIWLGIVFISLVFLSRDMAISKYGSISIFLISIPIYVYFSVKYASKLGATIGSEDEKIKNSKLLPQHLKRHVTKFDLWFAGVFLISMPLYFIFGQYVFGRTESQLSGYLKWIFLLAVCLELLLRKKFGKIVK